jgi:hypothetical protein
MEEKVHPELREVKSGHWVATWNAAGYEGAKETPPPGPRLSFRRKQERAVVTAV